MKENRYSEIDKLFQAKLKKDGNKPAEWNTPTDDIFEAAQKQFNKKNKRSRKALFIWLAGGISLLTLGIISTLFFLDKPSNQYVDATIAHEQPLNQNKDISATTNPLYESGVHNTTSLEEEKTPSLNEPNNNTNQNNQKKASKKQLSYINELTQPTSDVIENSENQISELNNSEEGAITQDKNRNPVFAVQATDKESRDIKIVDPLTNLYATVDNYKRIIDLSLPQPFTEEKKSPKPISLFATAGLSFSNMKMTNLTPTNYSLTEYERFYLGQYFGLGVSKPLTKSWSFQTTLSYERIVNKSAFQFEDSYQESKESINMDGSVRYSDQVQIESPMGPYSGSYDFTNDIGLKQNDLMNHTSQNQQYYQMLGLSLFVDYQIELASRLSLHLNTGPSVNYLLDYTHNMEMEMTKGDNSMIMTRSFESKDMTEVNRYFVTYNINSGIDFKLSSHTNLITQIGYARSLRSLRTVSTSADSKTLLSSIRTGVAISHKF